MAKPTLTDDRQGDHTKQARRLGAVTAVAVCAALGACGSSMPTLNTAAVARAIEGSILAQHHLHASVRCPKDLPRKTGLTFTCTANLDVGSYPIRVTERNAAGRVRYENDAPLVALDIARVETAIRRSIRSQRHLSSDVICPAEVIQKTATRFTCIASVNGQRYPFAVTEVDGDGHVRYVGLHQVG